MALQIKRTPDSITLTDTDVRDALMDYVEKHTGRIILNVANDGIKYHASGGGVHDSKTFERMYTTVLLKDAEPTVRCVVTSEDPGEPRAKKPLLAHACLRDLKPFIRRLEDPSYKAVPADIQILRGAVVLIGRLNRHEGDSSDLDPLK